MPRPPRIDVPGLPQHVWVRGNNRLPCFFTDKDRHVYLGYLREEAEERSCDIHSYVLMTNHVHLLVTGREARSISRFMQLVNRRYCRFVNLEHKRTGTLYEGRFNSSLVKTDGYFLTLMHYIEFNPVRAGIAARPDDYRWSSFRENVGGAPEDILTPHVVYEALGSNRFERSLAYRKLFNTALDDATLGKIREGIIKGKPTEL